MKDKISKLINVFKKDGFSKTILKTLRYFKANYLSKINFIATLDVKYHQKEYVQQLTDIFNAHYDRIIVWRGNFGWNVPLYQRPQHVALELAKQKCLVLYEVTTFTDNVKTIQKVQENLYLVNFNNKEYAKLIFNALNELNKPKYLQIYSTQWQISLAELKKYISLGYKVIYEYIDELSADIIGTKQLPQNIIDKFEYCLKDTKNVYVVATADKLYQDIQNKRGQNKLIFSTNGVDYEFFQNFNNYHVDEEFKEIIANGKINIGYYGALAKWVDYELLRKISQTNKYNILLFGSKYDDSYDNSKIDNEENIYYLGVRDYKVLKFYAKNIDILTIPFLINDITKSTSPLKLFEYMALHKPIVSTNINECRKYQSVFVAKSKKAFLESLELAYSHKDDKRYIKLLDKEAKENSWTSKVEAITKVLESDEKDLL